MYVAKYHGNYTIMSIYQKYDDTKISNQIMS